MRAYALAFALTTFVACSSNEATSPSAGDAGTETSSGPRPVVAGAGPYEAAGPHPVGHAVFAATDAARGRTLTMQVWYPAAASAPRDGTALEALVDDAADREALAGLVSAAPATCTRKRVGSTRDATPAEGTWPVLAFSHCHGCARFAAGAIAERLASHGYAVVAPDHAGNTLFDAQRGVNAPLNGEFLATRAADVRFALDVVLDAGSTTLPAALRGRFDAAKVGVFGHSYGAATTGLVLETDPRPKAGVAIAAPIENDLLPPAKMANVKVPVMFLLAREDNSISEIGNQLIRSNFDRGNPPLWLVEVEDAGHWSFSDVCGLGDAFEAGCGEGERQTSPGEPFWYLDPEGARGLAASYVTSFFAAHLGGDAAAKAWLAAAHPSGVVTTKVRD